MNMANERLEPIDYWGLTYCEFCDNEIEDDAKLIEEPLINNLTQKYIVCDDCYNKELAKG